MDLYTLLLKLQPPQHFKKWMVSYWTAGIFGCNLHTRDNSMNSRRNKGLEGWQIAFLYSTFGNEQCYVSFPCLLCEGKYVDVFVPTFSDKSNFHNNILIF